MNCVEARHLILIADPATLRGAGDATLREHIDGCARCAGDAARVLGDIDRLRSALIARGARPVAPARRTRSRVVTTMIPIALAAELALFAFLSNRNTVNPLTSRRVIDDTVTTLLPVAHTKIDTGEVTRRPKAHRAGSAQAVARVASRDTAADPDTAAVTDLQSVEPTSQLQVAPTNRRQRVAIIGTTDPKVHVVWLTKVDSL